MPDRARLLSTALFGALVFGSVACAGSAHLVAADGSHRLIARAGDTGLTVILTTESWPGDPGYAEQMTIVHVLVANMGSEPVLLAPGDFSLRDHRGFEYALLDAGGSFRAVQPGEDPAAIPEQGIPYDPGAGTSFETVRSDDGELSQLALPWGVLYPGTQMRGFLYFDDVRGSANHVDLLWGAQTPDHRPIATLGFQLHVAHP